MRNGGGPTVIEADTYRYFHQNGPFPGSAFGYRSKIEEAAWRDRDPITKIEGHLVRRGLYTEDELATVRKSIKAAMGEVGAAWSSRTRTSCAAGASCGPTPWSATATGFR